MNNRNHVLTCMPAFVVLSLAAATPMCAGTINFTYTINGSSVLGAQPSPAILTVPETFNGSGSSTPLGALADSEAASFTFLAGPGFFIPASETGTFIFSLHGGADTFSGTEAVVFTLDPVAMGVTEKETRSILSGTGIFSGAAGTLTGTGVFMPNMGPHPPDGFGSFSGGGAISAPGLASVPEPNTILLLASTLAGVAVFRNKCRK